MKWFHHECAARHDPKLQMLGASHGAEGIGIYWGLLEEIGQHSDTFHLKVIGIDEDADNRFKIETMNIPRLPMKLLAKNLFTSSKKLHAIITLCVEVGLFDLRKWLDFNVLYSPSFEHRADDYTRRVRRSHVLSKVEEPVLSEVEGSENVRTNSEQSTNKPRTSSEVSTHNVRTIPVLIPTPSGEVSEVATDNVGVETDTDSEGEEKKSIRRKEEKMLFKNTSNVDKSKSSQRVDLLTNPTSETDLSAEASAKTESLYLIEPSDEVFDEYSLRFHSIIQKWNREHPTRVIEWHPATGEFMKLFYAGEYDHKLSMCFHAYKLLGGRINYPELVIRALRLMLLTNAKGRIENPFGWLWTCLHGNGNGTKPWVQLLTSEEETAIYSPARSSEESRGLP